MNRLGWHLQDLGALTGLRALGLSNNKLLHLHASLWRLTDLEELDLGHNALSALAPELGELKGLTVGGGVGVGPGEGGRWRDRGGRREESRPTGKGEP
jgi:hypothetical protein